MLVPITTKVSCVVLAREGHSIALNSTNSPLKKSIGLVFA